MTPLPESITHPEIVPSIVGATLRVGAALILLLAGAWAFLRWRGRGPQSRREIRVLDRAALTRGTGLAVVAVANRRLLVGFSATGARLIATLDDPDTPTFEEFLEASSEEAAS